MLTTFNFILDLVTALIQYPVLTIVCISVIGVIGYTIEQKSHEANKKAPPQPESEKNPSDFIDRWN